MTSQNDLTLLQFFDAEDAKARKDGLNALYSTAVMRSTQALLSTAPTLLQNHVAQSVTEALKGVLSVPLVDVLSSAWTTRRELKQYLDRSKFPREELIDHALGKHEIQSTHRPKLQIMLDNSPIGAEFEFAVTVALNVEAAILRIQDGRIMHAQLGKVSGSGAIKCEEATLFARATKPVALAQTLSFGQGIAIPWPKELALTSSVNAA
ncbi:MAG: hypothetical protein ACKVRO_06515 [Micropepsaceae bacterium]